jgi:hypothetical protein
LEDRLAPALLTVNSLADALISGTSSTLTLREAVALINSGGTVTDSIGSSLAIAKAGQIETSHPFGLMDTIRFDPHLFGPTQKQIVLNDGELTLSTDVLIDGPGASRLAVNGNNQSRVFEIAGRATVNISGLTVEGGEAVSGGGIANGGALTLIDSTVSGNAAELNGGIVNTGSLTLIRSTVSGNTAALGNGGIANYGGTTALIESRVSGNSAYWAGGVGNYGGAMTLTDSTVTGNSASNWGGIINTGVMKVTDSTVSDNSSQHNNGGIVNTGTLTLTESTISGNTARGDTGGIINYGGALTLTRSTVSGNSASNWGGITNTGTLTITDSTVSRNLAAGTGGGIVNLDGALTLLDSIVSENRASAAGGIYNHGALWARNSKILQNAVSDLTGKGAFHDQGFNRIGIVDDASSLVPLGALNDPSGSAGTSTAAVVGLGGAKSYRSVSSDHPDAAPADHFFTGSSVQSFRLSGFSDWTEMDQIDAWSFSDHSWMTAWGAGDSLSLELLKLSG